MKRANGTTGRWQGLLLGIAALYAFLTLAYMLYNSATNPLGSIDFHSYWHAAHFLRQGRDPYRAWLVRESPTPPFEYLDGVTVNADPAQRNLQTIPANTAPLLILLAPFALWSWVPAKTVWLFLNTGLMLAAPWLTIRVAEQHAIPLSRWGQAAVALAFYAIAAPRFAVGYGQTSLLVFDLMMVALLVWRKHPAAAGVALGVALSKYSLVFPVVVLLAVWRGWRVIGTAVLVQAVGLLIVNTVGGSAPVETVQAYIAIAISHVGNSGIHIGSLFNSSALFRIVAPVLLTVIPAVFLYRVRDVLNPGMTGVSHTAALRGEFSLIVIGLLWGALVVYHRLYDGILILPFLVLLAWATARLSPRISTLLYWYGGALVTALSLPMPLYEWIFGSYWSKIVNSVWTLIFCSAVAVTLWMLTRVTRLQAAGFDKEAG